MTASPQPDGVATSFLNVLPDEILGDVVARSVSMNLEAGRFLYEPELAVLDRGLLRGFVADSTGRQLTVSYLGPSSAVGLTHLMGRSFPAAYQAVSHSRLLQLNREQVTELAERFPRLGWSATREVTRRLDDVLAEATRVAFGSMRKRLAFHLLALTSADQDGGPDRPVRQADLALAVGSVREVIGRTVVQLRDAGMVSTGAAGVRIVDRVGLRRISEDRT